ncbi:hypothetical protein [Streptomyces sp. NPDC046853]|uniref:hypothetical protein n=1 Tax=unclassified Streptomyces TaxID=2593676 RepID=UPI0033D0A2BC
MGRSMRAARLPAAGAFQSRADVRGPGVVRIDNSGRDSVPDTDGIAASNPRH